MTGEKLGEAEEPYFDNDANGSASVDTLKSTIRVDGIELCKGHDMCLRSGSDVIRFRMRGQRVQMTIQNSQLMSSVRLQPHRLLDPLVRLSVVDIVGGNFVWKDANENGYYVVSNALCNQLLAG